MQEGLASEHDREVLSHTLEHHINRNAAASKSHGHLLAFWWNVADVAFYVVRNPRDGITGILVLHAENLLINSLDAQSATEEARGNWANVKS